MSISAAFLSDFSPSPGSVSRGVTPRAGSPGLQIRTSSPVGGLPARSATPQIHSINPDKGEFDQVLKKMPLESRAAMIVQSTQLVLNTVPQPQAPERAQIEAAISNLPPEKETQFTSILQRVLQIAPADLLTEIQRLEPGLTQLTESRFLRQRILNSLNGS